MCTGWIKEGSTFSSKIKSITCPQLSQSSAFTPTDFAFSFDYFALVAHFLY